MSNTIYALIEKHIEHQANYLPTSVKRECFIDWSTVDIHEGHSNVGNPEYKTGPEHHCYGKKLSEAHKSKVSKANMGNKSKTGRTGKLHPLFGLKGGDSPSARKAMVNGVIYNSCTEAAEACGITKSTFSYWLKHGKAVKI